MAGMFAANESNATNVICGIPVVEGVLVLANELSACQDDYPSDLVDWHIDRMPGMVPYYWTFGTIGLMIVAANAMIIVGVTRDVKLRKQLFLLQIVGQAVSDLNVGILISAYTFGTIARDWQLLGGEIGCSFYGYAITATCHCTVFSLTWIAYVRKEKVLCNRNVPLKKMRNLYVFGVLGGMVFMGVYYSLVTKSRLVSSGSFCNPIYNSPVIIPAALAILCPIAFIVYTYYKVNKMMVKTMAAAKSKSKSKTKTAGSNRFGNLKQGLSNLAKATRGSVHRPAVVPEQGAHQPSAPVAPVMNTGEMKRAKQQARATRLMILMCASILVLWTPLYIYFAYVVGLAIIGETLPGMEYAEMCLGMAAACSSLCSPIIYGLSNRTMRNAMLFAFLPLEWKFAYAKRAKSTKSRWRNLHRGNFAAKFMHARFGPSSVAPTTLTSSAVPSTCDDPKRAPSSIFESESTARKTVVGGPSKKTLPPSKASALN